MNLPRMKIAHIPTPIEALPRLSARLGGPKIFIKRDDQTGLAFGGNKTRKLDFLIADARSHGADTLITAGSVQSNHCRQTAAAAARYGFNCILILMGEKPGCISGNLFLDIMFDAEIVWGENRDRDQLLQEIFDTAWREERRPYLIPYGGSNEIGAASYVLAFNEMLNQIKDGEGSLSSIPDCIVLATSSGGTQAGLIAGKLNSGYPGKIIGISVDKEAEELRDDILALTVNLLDYNDLNFELSGEFVIVNDNFLGDGYGIPGIREIEAIKLFANLEGILLDPVYTGRAAGGLIELIKAGYFSNNEEVLFWHTGGTPALFAKKYQYLFT